MSKTTTTDLICPECGNVFRIMRRVDRQKELFHRKKMYCYVCKRETNHIEVKDLELLIAEMEFLDKTNIPPEKEKVYQLIKKRSD